MDAKIVVYRDDSGSDQPWRWSCVAANGEIVAQGESHTTEHDAKRAAHTAADLLGEAINDL